MVHAEDSIFVVSRANNLYLYDKSFNILKKVEYNDFLTHQKEPLGEDAIFKPGKTLFLDSLLVQAFYTLSNAKTKSFYQGKNAVSFALTNSGQAPTEFSVYPSQYRNENEGIYFQLQETQMAHHHLSNHIVHSYMGVDNLFVYNVETGKQVENYSIPSIFLLNAIEPLIEKEGQDIDFQKEEDYMTTTPFYFWLVYDPTHKIHYRLVKHKQPLKNAQGELNNTLTAPMSIQAIDLENQKALEFKIPIGKFSPLVAFCAEGKLWLWLSPELNPELSEDELIFIGIKNPFLQ